LGAAVVGVSEAAGVSMSMASSSRDGVAVCDSAATLARPFFLGGIVYVSIRNGMR